MLLAPVKRRPEEPAAAGQADAAPAPAADAAPAPAEADQASA